MTLGGEKGTHRRVGASVLLVAVLYFWGVGGGKVCWVVGGIGNAFSQLIFSFLCCPFFFFVEEKNTIRLFF